MTPTEANFMKMRIYNTVDFLKQYNNLSSQQLEQMGLSPGADQLEMRAGLRAALRSLSSVESTLRATRVSKLSAKELDTEARKWISFKQIRYPQFRSAIITRAREISEEWDNMTKGFRK